MATVSAFPTGTGTSTQEAGTITFANAASGLNADDGTKVTMQTATKNSIGNVVAGTFGFDSSLPANASIDAVSVEVQDNTVTTAQGTQEAFVRISATETLAGTHTGSLTETVRTFSSVARPGGGSWTRADLLDATFTVKVRGTQPNNTTSTTYAWDYVKVTVDYSLVVPPPILVTGRVAR